MSRLGLGTAQFGLSYGIANRSGQVSRLEALSMLQLVKANGVDTIDTAIMYGESEACLGEIGIQGLNIVTKLPKIPDGNTDVNRWVTYQMSESLSRMGVSSIYGLLLHRPDQLMGFYGTSLYRALQGLKDAGIVKKIGVSIYSPNELELLLPNYKIDLVQASFNLIDRRLYQTGWLHRLKDLGVEIHTRSVFLQGVLLMKQPALPSQFSQWSELFDKWYQWLGESELSPIQASLAFPMSFSEIDRVIVGADSMQQLNEILKAAANNMTYDLPDLQSTDDKLINPSMWINI